MATRLILRLNAPGMTSLHKVGLAGIYMTLKALEAPNGPRSGKPIEGLSWCLTADSVELDFQGDSVRPAFEELVKESFQVDKEGFFCFPALETGGKPSVEDRQMLHSALLSTFLQHGKTRAKGAPRILNFMIDKAPALVNDFAPIVSYRHQDAADVFLEHDRFCSEVPLAGWLYPGGGTRHVQYPGSAVAEPPELALCLLYAPVGSIFFQLDSRLRKRKARGALVLPTITNLESYATVRGYFARAGVLHLTASGGSDAALSYLTTLSTVKTGRVIEAEGAGQAGCRVITFGIVAWNEKQKSRTMARSVVPESLPGLKNYELASSFFSNRAVRREAQKNRRGETVVPEHVFAATPVCREIIADNVTRGLPWYSEFGDWISNKEIYTAISYERKELSKMVDAAEYDDENEKHFVKACHEAWRRRMGRLASRARVENASFTDLVRRERERLRTGLARCKNATTLRETVIDFWSREGTLETLQEHWVELLRLFDERHWRMARDLALLALVSYKSDTTSDEPDSDPTNVTPDMNDSQKGDER